MVDYLFLSRELMRVQATANVNNIASQGGSRKGWLQERRVNSKSGFNRGKWCDHYLYSIPREEWKEPRILTRTT